MDKRVLAQLTWIAVLLSSGCPTGSEADIESTFEPQVVTAEVWIDDSIVVRGKVFDSLTHEPVPTAWIVDRSPRSAGKFPTQDDGSFEARIRPSKSDDRFDIGIVAEHYCSIQRTWSLEELEQGVPLEISLPRTAGVEGVVRDSNGRPVADLRLILAPPLPEIGSPDSSIEDVPAPMQALLCPWSVEPRFISRPRLARTDASGRFAVDDLVPWMPAFRVEGLSKYGFPDPTPVCEFAGGALGGPGERTHVEMRVNNVHGGYVEGRLLLNGQPISGDVDWEGPTRRGSGKAGPDGRFYLDEVEVGLVTICTLRSTGTPEWLGFPKSYALEIAAESTLEPDLDLEIPAPTAASSCEREARRLR